MSRWETKLGREQPPHPPDDGREPGLRRVSASRARASSRPWREAWICAQEESHRRFYCARCGRATLTCRRCGRECSEAVRRRKQHEAARRYRRSELGRRNDAARQKRYRKRRRRGATHQVPAREGSREARPEAAATGVAAILSAEERLDASKTESLADSDPDGELRCDFCGRPCGRSTRWGPLPPPRRATRRRHLPRDTFRGELLAPGRLTMIDKEIEAEIARLYHISESSSSMSASL